ncbi:MAG: class I SAM-dependent methyltransferase [Gammaproteobacteria bacterium]|nr:class I SAM-dependent methyltransferase [Gammaproteobacteria bacterium]
MMNLMTPVIERTCSEREIYSQVLPLDGAKIVDLGCGRAELTRLIASHGVNRQITALEVDKIQHLLNLDIVDLPNVEFKLAGAQEIPASDATFDVALMFKSLHHVPAELMLPSLSEIHRVLKPGGHLYVSEPIFAGDFNDILRLFHNEERVRTLAFQALKDSVAQGVFEFLDEIFFNAPVKFQDFSDYERTVIGVTHTRHHLSPEVHAEVKRRIDLRRTPEGVKFLMPMRVDLLRKPSLREA